MLWSMYVIFNHCVPCLSERTASSVCVICVCLSIVCCSSSFWFLWNNPVILITLCNKTAQFLCITVYHHLKRFDRLCCLYDLYGKNPNKIGALNFDFCMIMHWYQWKSCCACKLGFSPNWSFWLDNHKPLIVKVIYLIFLKYHGHHWKMLYKIKAS